MKRYLILVVALWASRAYAQASPEQTDLMREQARLMREQLDLQRQQSLVPQQNQSPPPPPPPLSDAQMQMAINQEIARMDQAARAAMAQQVRLHGNQMIDQYKLVMETHRRLRFENWIAFQDKDTLARVINIQPKKDYIDSLTKKHYDVEPPDEFKGRYDNAVRDYFSRHILVKDAGDQAETQVLSQMRISITSGLMPETPENPAPIGTPPEQSAVWVAWQYEYPGVPVFDIFQQANDEVGKKIKNEGLSVDDGVKLCNQLFRSRAADAVKLK